MTMNMHICLSTTAVWGKMSAIPWVSLIQVNAHAFVYFDVYPCFWMHASLCSRTHEPTCEFPFCHISVSLIMLHNPLYNDMAHCPASSSPLLLSQLAQPTQVGSCSSFSAHNHTNKASAWGK